MEKDENRGQKIRVWVKRFGVAGFLFFFIKGLLWLIVPSLILWWGATTQA